MRQITIMEPLERYVEARAPVNIAVIKYWGKLDQDFKIPLNDSLSGTLNLDDMCTTTSVLLSPKNTQDELFLNGQEQQLCEKSPATRMLREIRSLVSPDNQLPKMNAKIITNNNFPTAAGLASSASGYACLAYTLGSAYGITDRVLLSKIARNGSGSACRSLYGGFVQWIKGNSHDTSYAQQVVDHRHWPEMRVLICVVNDSKKDVSSSHGMAKSVQTSPLIHHRAALVVPERIRQIKQAIIDKDFQSFAKITMQESNEFHAICLDTFPPIFYLNETSQMIINICHLVNEFMGEIKVAYTFDAGPNACIYLLDDFVPTLLSTVDHFFPNHDAPNSLLEVKGRGRETGRGEVIPNFYSMIRHIEAANIVKKAKSVKYLISTSIGDGPRECSNDRSS